MHTEKNENNELDVCGKIMKDNFVSKLLGIALIGVKWWKTHIVCLLKMETKGGYSEKESVWKAKRSTWEEFDGSV